MLKEIALSPYRYNYHGKYRVILGVVTFFLVFYVTYYMEVHTVYVPGHKMDFFWICIIHSSIAALVFTILTYFLEYSFNAKEKWRLFNEVLLILSILFFIGVSNFLVRDLIYDNSNNWSLHYFYEEVRNAVATGFLVGGLVILLGYFLQVKNNVDYASEHTNSINNQTDEMIHIDCKVKKETFAVNPKQILYAQSDGNYTEIFLNSNGQKVVRMIKRITLSDFEKQLASANHILKVHKSYLVNLIEVDDVSGNSAGLKIRLKHFQDVKIPVSRNNIPKFEARLASLR